MQRGAPQRNTTADYDVEDMDEAEGGHGHDKTTSSGEETYEEEQLKRQRRKKVRR